MKLKNTLEQKIPVMGWTSKVIKEKIEEMKKILKQNVEDPSIYDDMSFDNIAYISLEDSTTLNCVTIFIIKNANEINDSNSPLYIETRKHTYKEENGRKKYEFVGHSFDIIKSKTEALAYSLTLGYNSKFREDIKNILFIEDFSKDNIIATLEDTIRMNREDSNGFYESTGAQLIWDGTCHFWA
jgi:hypothetical protein